MKQDPNQTVPSAEPGQTSSPEEEVVVLVGNPNVGKSVLFSALSGRRVIVSNYPGTTVEIARGTLKNNGRSCPIIDTPGIHSIVPFSEDERVTQKILLTHDLATVINVVDMKNLQRGLLMALELGEAGLPFVLNLNMADEAETRGIKVDKKKLEQVLGIPVISTVATQGLGLEELIHSLDNASTSSYHISYSKPIEEAISNVKKLLPKTNLSKRSLALIALAGDEGLSSQVELSDSVQALIQTIQQETEEKLGHPMAYAINRERLQAVNSILEQVIQRRSTGQSISATMGKWLAHPIAGWPILAVILYLVYQFVGVLGAGTLVDFLETNIFETYINPWSTQLVNSLLPFTIVQEFLVGDYGIITMALTYSLAIVLPIVSTFFLAFSLLEDSGYLPRLAVMLNRSFRVLGLNGKAVLPMILGLGCTTMATMTTRILESRKERLQVTLLLALGVPCSAQLGVMLGMVASVGTTATLIWIGVVVCSLLAVGYLAAKVIPGQQSDFLLELPPIRMPSFKNIVVKTFARLEWYLKEVVPVFIFGTAALFVLNKLSILTMIENFLSPIIVGWLNLPAEVTGALLVGFLRRDYGAVGIFSLARTDVMDPLQILVSLVVITLFMPCIANFLMIVKEFGAKFAVAVAAFVFPFALFVGGLLNLVLVHLNILVR